MFTRLLALSTAFVLISANAAIASGTPDKHRGSGRLQTVVVVNESAGCNRQCSACNPTGC